MTPREAKFFCIGIALALCFILGSMYMSSCDEDPMSVGVPKMIGTSTIDGRVNFSWTAPTVGTPVAAYIMFVDWERGKDYVVFGITNLYHAIEIRDNDSVRVKVAGLDSLGTRGPYSIYSEVYPPKDPYERHSE
jgi:hypothetical protein